MSYRGVKPYIVLLGLAALLVARPTSPSPPPPMVGILNPGPGTSDSPALVSLRPGTNDFRVQVQVWNDVADVTAVHAGWCLSSADPENPASWTWSDPAVLNTSYACGSGCGVYDLLLSGLAPGTDYRLRARAISTADGTGYSSDRRQGSARFIYLRVNAPGSGTGMLLVRDGSSQLCMDCHALKSHSSQSTDAGYGNWHVACLECHAPHGTTNVSLVREGIETPNGGRRDVRLFRYGGDVANGHVDSSAGAVTTAVCQVCHANTRDRAGNPRWRGSGNSDAAHHAAGGPAGTRRCTICHTHEDGFAHFRAIGSAGCAACHGHDAGWQGDGNLGKGTFRSHSTHTENDADDVRGPFLPCDGCHDVPNYPYFKSGADGDGDGRFDLAETNVCDGCHSAGGAYDGVADAAIGAKPNWRNGVYAGASLPAGKERWCVGCHDTGTSVIPAVGGRQAPNVAGDGTTYGYYFSGHGAYGTECESCHDVSANHNLDGRKTYAGAQHNHAAGFRLSPVNGGPPLNIPFETWTGYNAADFALCLSCHDAQALFSDTRSRGVYGNTTNPYLNAASITTGFRNLSWNGLRGSNRASVPSNIHADHLIDVHAYGGHWYSDGPGTFTGDSYYNCVTCHDPHGPQADAGGPTPRMTLATFAVSHASDAIGEYNYLGSAAWIDEPARATCAVACHWYGPPDAPFERWYASAVPSQPILTLADASSADPVAAEAGYTNQRTISVTLQADAYRTEMRLAEDAAFSVNSTGWIPFVQSSTYTFTPGDGVRNVYAQVRNALGESASVSASITLDTTPPTVPSNALVAPNGGEVWVRYSVQTIAWSGVTDGWLRPLAFHLSTDGGLTFPYTITTGVANDPPYTWAWTVPGYVSTTAVVRLLATDRAGNQASDTSDATFTISAM